MAKTPEGKVKDQVKAVLNSYGAYYFMPVQTGYGAPGLDFHCCHHGYAFFVETKAEGKKLTPRQEATVRAIEAAGGRFFLVSNSAQLELLTGWLESVTTELEFDASLYRGEIDQ